MNLVEVLTVFRNRREPPKERRHEERIPAHERAVVCWKDHLGLPKAHSITIVNVSNSGVAFASPDHVPVGQVISITATTRSMDCIVRHVSTTPRGYYLGAQVVFRSGTEHTMSAIKDLAEEGKAASDEQPAVE